MAVLTLGLPAKVVAQGYRALLFLLVMLAVWIVAGVVFKSAILGFAAGLISATFAVGAATLKQNRDGSWILRKSS